jgi:membrane-bound lytic murein transglycosylase B
VSFKSKSIIPEQVSFQGLLVSGLNPLNLVVNPLPQRSTPAVKPGEYNSVYVAAGKKFGVPWQIIAAVHYVETRQSGDTGRKSSAGAQGPMQFMQPTFDAYQEDGDGDGVKSINDVHDAIFTAANHLAANGAGRGNVRQALYRYNHSDIYVDKVLNYAVGLGYAN